jgi:undecaprenyl-diphosphatase
VLGAVVAVTLGVVFAGQATGSSLDGRVAAALELPQTFLSPAYAVCIIVQTLADPIPAAVLVLLLAAACLRYGRRRLAVLAVAGPGAADMIVIFTKHIVGRTIHDGSLTYPSTHTAQNAALAMVTALLATALLKLEAGAGAALVLGAAAAGALVMGWALVAGSVHYVTDTLAGLCVAVAVVPAAAWCTDLLADRVSKGRRVGTSV